MEVPGGEAIVGRELARVSNLLDRGLYATQALYGKPCRVTQVLPDLPEVSATGTEACYSFSSGIMRVRPSFLRSCATFTSRTYRKLPPPEQAEFLKQFTKHMGTFHHESIHSTVDPEQAKQDAQMLGKGDFDPVREAITNVAAEREESNWLRHSGLKEEEPRLGTRGVREERGYPGHMRAIDSLLDRIESNHPGGSEALVRTMVVRGTGSGAVEELAQALYPSGGLMDKANTVLRLNRGFGELSEDLHRITTEIHRDSSRFHQLLHEHLSRGDKVASELSSWLTARAPAGRPPDTPKMIAKFIPAKDRTRKDHGLED